MIVKVCKLDEIELAGAKVKTGIGNIIEPKIPIYGKEGDACMDIYPIAVEYDIKRDRFIYHTGLAFAIGDNIVRTEVPGDKIISIENVKVPNEMEIRPRSNLTKSDFYMPNAPGTLDWGYRGELLIILKNRTSAFMFNAIKYLTNAVDKLAMRVGANAEIKQYTSFVRTNLMEVQNSILEPPYKCDGNDRCCQIIIRGSQRITFQEVETIEELGETERGSKGFGEGTGGAVK